jgi:hypothetical protein
LPRSLIPRAESGFSGFPAALLGAGESVHINATPSTVNSSVTAFEDAASVSLVANSGSVSITGNYSTTVVTLGQSGQGLNSLATTAGINANVSVLGVHTLIVADNGNTTTQENVTVTEPRRDLNRLKRGVGAPGWSCLIRPIRLPRILTDPVAGRMLTRLGAVLPVDPFARRS